MIDYWKVTGQLLSFLFGLITSAAIIATYVKWLLWAGSGWLW